jgi:hypothetical protein
VAPKAALLVDLGARTEPRSDAVSPQPAFQFTVEQLDLYGVYELQVLEDLLRSESPDKLASLDSVSARVRSKIGWTGDGRTPDSERFLLEFYAPNGPVSSTRCCWDAVRSASSAASSVNANLPQDESHDGHQKPLSFRFGAQNQPGSFAFLFR